MKGALTAAQGGLSVDIQGSGIRAATPAAAGEAGLTLRLGPTGLFSEISESMLLAATPSVYSTTLRFQKTKVTFEGNDEAEVSGSLTLAADYLTRLVVERFGKILEAPDAPKHELPKGPWLLFERDGHKVKLAHVDLQGKMLSDVALVAFVERKRRPLSSCAYNDTNNDGRLVRGGLVRFAGFERKVVVLSARTGSRILERTFQPVGFSCPEIVSGVDVGSERLFDPRDDRVVEWLTTSLRAPG
jgi:hypothetical protein